MGTATNTLVLMDFWVTLCDVNGKSYGKALLKDVQVNPNFNYNLLSINWLLKDGFNLSGNSDSLALIQFDDNVLDVKIHIDSSFYYRDIWSVTYPGSLRLQQQTMHSVLMKYTISLDTTTKNRTQEIAKALGIVLKKGPMEVCESCATAKAKQKNTTHDTSGHGKSTTYNNKVYSDLSFIYQPNKKQAYKYVWHLMIDSATWYGTDGFYKAKRQLYWTGMWTTPKMEKYWKWG